MTPKPIVAADRAAELSLMLARHFEPEPTIFNFPHYWWTYSPEHSAPRLRWQPRPITDPEIFVRCLKELHKLHWAIDFSVCHIVKLYEPIKRIAIKVTPTMQMEEMPAEALVKVLNLEVEP